MTDHPEHGLTLQYNTELLHRISARLADRFARQDPQTRLAFP